MPLISIASIFLIENFLSCVQEVSLYAGRRTLFYPGWNIFGPIWPLTMKIWPKFKFRLGQRMILNPSPYWPIINIRCHQHLIEVLVLGRLTRTTLTPSASLTTVQLSISIITHKAQRAYSTRLISSQHQFFHISQGKMTYHYSVYSYNFGRVSKCTNSHKRQQL